jgi:hypothetical protein
MKRTAFVIVAVLACQSVNLFAADAIDRRKAETTAKADKLFGRRYIAAAGKPLRLYDEQTELGPPEVIYWYGSIYVIELIFAADGTIARLAMLPEALLHSDDWSDVSKTVALSRAEMRWLVASANALQPLGAGKIREAPDGCFQSGPNLYCVDSYELASVSHYHIVLEHEKNATKSELRDISILYRQSVNGVVEDARVDGSQRQIKVDGQWYHGENPGTEIFERAQKGSVVRFTTYGCAANEKVCLAGAEQSKSTTTR